MTLNALVWVIGFIMVAALFLLFTRSTDDGRSKRVSYGKYTFILLVFNQEDRIEGLIRELRRMRCRYPAFELLVVDKGSTDRTVKVLEQLWREKEDFQWTVLPESDQPVIDFSTWNSQNV